MFEATLNLTRPIHTDILAENVKLLFLQMYNRASTFPKPKAILQTIAKNIYIIKASERLWLLVNILTMIKQF